MPTGSQYGIDLGNILSSASAIKTARLRNEAIDETLEQKESEKRNVLRDIERRQSKQVSDNVLNGEKIAGPANVIAPFSPSQTSMNLTQQEIQDYANNPAMYKERVKEFEGNLLYQRRYNANKEMLKVSMPNATPQQIETLATQDSKYIKDFADIVSKSDEAGRKKLVDVVNKEARQLFMVTQVGNNLQDPALKIKAKQEAWTQYRDAKIMSAPEDKKEEVSQAIPSTYNANWIGQKMAESKDVFDTIVDINNKEAKYKADAKKPSTKSSEFERLTKLVNDPTIPTNEKEMIKKRLTKLTQSDMSSLKINVNTVKEAQNAFANKLGLDDPYKLSTADTRKWTPEQQAEANQVASVIVKGLGANAKLAEKKMGEYGSMSDQMQNALSEYESVGEFRALDEGVKKYFSNYFGLSEKELQSTEASQAFQSMMNIKIKADSGSAVSGQEMVRNVLETASPFMTKERIKLGVKNVAKRYVGELKTLKRVMGQTAFNLKYGAVLSNYQDIIKAVDTEKTSKKDDLARLRKAKQDKKPSRQSSYDKIKAQRPNATKAQIDAYLDSKGL